MLHKYMEVQMKILKIDTFRIDEDDNDMGSEDPEKDDEPADDDWD